MQLLHTYFNTTASLKTLLLGFIFELLRFLHSCLCLPIYLSMSYVTTAANVASIFLMTLFTAQLRSLVEYDIYREYHT